MARNRSLGLAIDKDVYKFVCKLVDEDEEAGNLPTLSYVWEKIQRSNSPLRRKPKIVIQDSIDRVLQSLSEELGSQSDVDEVEEATNTELSSAMNRHVRKHLAPRPLSFVSQDVSSTNVTADSQPASINHSAKKRPQDSSAAEPALPKRIRKSKGTSLDTAPPRHVTLNDVGGMGPVVNYFKETVLVPLISPKAYINIGISPPCGILLHGPPGCGKTFIAEALAGSLGLPFLRISAPSIVSGMSGESEKQLRQHFEHAKTLAPCLMFIDEIDTIAPKRESAQREMERRIVGQLLTCMDDLAFERTGGKPVLVLAATNRADSLDPALRRAGRFDTELLIRAPTTETREAILKTQTQKMKIDPDVDFKVLAMRTAGFVGADLKSLVNTAGSQAISRKRQALEEHASAMRSNNVQHETAVAEVVGTEGMEIDSKTQRPAAQDPEVQAFEILHAALLADSTGDMMRCSVTQADFLTALPRVQPSARREGFTTVPDTTWASVGALDNVRQELFSAIVHPVRNPGLYQRFHTAVPTGILLHGPPGCGKTLLAKAVANEAGASFIAINGPELLNKYVGESERAIRQMFARAAASMPCVMFFDELDSVVPIRDSNNSESSNRVVAQLLTELDGLKDRSGIYVIGATNRFDNIDPAILRPGRFGNHIYVGLPDADGRAEILGAQLRNIPANDRHKMQDFVKENCEGFSGADLQSLIVRAVKSTLRREGLELELRDVVEARKAM